MRAINAAYGVLSDPERRAAYDARRYLPQAHAVPRVHRAPVYYQPPPTISRPRAVVARPPSRLQRRVDRFVGILGVLLLVGLGFYVVNLIPFVEQELQANRRGSIALVPSAEHPSGSVPQRLRTDDGLRTFPATVLVAPEDLAPFAALPVFRVDANGRGLARYAVYYGDWARGGATITGLIGRAAFDQALPQLPECALAASYCVGPAPGQSTGPPGLELFRAADLVEGDYPAFATHRVCCNGVFWSLSWYEPRANMSYSIDLSRTIAAPFGEDIGPQNLSAAQSVAALARQLVRLP
jgi:hypothetical protein